jgi:integrase
MATIRKITLKNGFSYKAIIKDRLGKAITSKTFTRKTDALIWAKRIEADKQAIAALGSKGPRMTFKDLVDEYTEQWQGKDAFWINRKSYWVKQIGDYRLRDIDTEFMRKQLKAFHLGDCLRGNGGKGKTTTFNTNRTRAAATVNRHKNTLSGIFKYAVQQGYIIDNPLVRISRLKDTNKKIRYLSDHERSALLAACQASDWPKLYLVVLLAMTTGMRKSEILGLRWNDIEFSSSLAFLHDTKNGEPRLCPIPSMTMTELKKFRELGTGFVFPSLIKPEQPIEFKKPWLKALELANIQNFRFHDLRHDFCSQLAMHGASLPEIAELAGHKDLQTTKRYVHLSFDHKQRLAERIMSKVLER